MTSLLPVLRVQGLVLGLLVLVAWQVVLVTRSAPAMVDGLRTEGITGETRTLNSVAMYSHSDYLFQTAVGFANADAFSFAGIEAPDVLATDATAGERAARAADLMRQSVRMDPGNGHKWFVLAQALAGDGQDVAAFHALETSHQLSPTMQRLAYQRAWLYWALFETAETLPLPEADRARYRALYLADRLVAERLDGQQEPLPPL